MSIEQAVLENLRELPPDAQRKVLSFSENRRRQSAPAIALLKSLHGLWTDLSVSLTDADITEARQEVWGKFPREIES